MVALGIEAQLSNGGGVAQKRENIGMLKIIQNNVGMPVSKLPTLDRD
jgi:hypothetical protein